MDGGYQNYLSDLGHLLRAQAMEAKQSLAAARSSDREVFEAGRLTGYYEVLSLLISQATAFQLSLADLRLEGLDPDRDLLVPRR
jgi:hypothetical protein